MYTSKLIILRGNSGSGKTSVARMLRSKSIRKTALIEQDVIRRDILQEKDANDMVNNLLILRIAETALSHGYDVILEGIFRFSRYETMLRELVGKCPDHFVYYFDIPFEETLRRHSTKPNAHEFGEAEMKGWFKENDVTGFPKERIIHVSSSLEETVASIYKETRL